MRAALLRSSFVLTLLIALSASGVPITVPSGLNGGDQYRLAFVTSTIRNAASTNIADYNSFVDGVAEAIPELAALTQDWKAIASTAAVDARTNTSTDPTPPGATGVPIFLLDGTRLVDDYDDLWDGTIDTTFSINETGAAIASVFTWTGTQSSGLAGAGATLGVAPPATVLLGQTVSTTAGWIGETIVSPNLCLHHRYAISGVLTAPVPEPGTGLLVIAGVLGLAGWRRARH